MTRKPALTGIVLVVAVIGAAIAIILAWLPRYSEQAIRQLAARIEGQGPAPSEAGQAAALRYQELFALVERQGLDLAKKTGYGVADYDHGWDDSTPEDPAPDPATILEYWRPIEALLADLQEGAVPEFDLEADPFETMPVPTRWLDWVTLAGEFTAAGGDTRHAFEIYLLALRTRPLRGMPEAFSASADSRVVADCASHLLGLLDDPSALSIEDLQRARRTAAEAEPTLARTVDTARRHGRGLLLALVDGVDRTPDEPAPLERAHDWSSVARSVRTLLEPPPTAWSDLSRRANRILRRAWSSDHPSDIVFARVLSTTVLETGSAVTILRRLQLALAVTEFQRKHGRPPTSIDELLPIIGVMPVDPFTDQPLRYTVTDDGYRITVIRDGVESRGDEPLNDSDLWPDDR